MEFRPPRIKKDVDGKIISHHHPFFGQGTMMGYPSERRQVRFSKLNYLTNKEVLEMDMWHETDRLVGGLELPLNKYEIKKAAHKFYDEFPHGTKFRRPRYVVPVIIYIECLERTIFINRKTLTKYFKCNFKSFNRCLREYYKRHRDILRKHCSSYFRMKLIYNALSGLKCQFNLPEDFLFLAGHFLFKFFPDLSNKKNSVIIGLLIAFIKDFYNGKMDHITMVSVCNWLGIRPSVISSNKTLIKKLERDN